MKLREPIFHHPEFGTTRRDYEAMTDADFWEVGASGRRYSREFVLETLENRAPDPDESKWLTRDFQCREIAADNYLITYTLHQGKRVTRRATLWRRTAAGFTPSRQPRSLMRRIARLMRLRPLPAKCAAR